MSAQTIVVKEIRAFIPKCIAKHDELLDHKGQIIDLMLLALAEESLVLADKMNISVSEIVYLLQGLLSHNIRQIAKE